LKLLKSVEVKIEDNIKAKYWNKNKMVFMKEVIQIDDK